MRVIPAIVFDRQGAYRTRKFEQTSYLGDVLNLTKIYSEHEVDEIILLSTDWKDNSSLHITSGDADAILKTATVPVSWGGGIYSFDDACLLIRSGADRLIFRAINQHQLRISEAVADSFGHQSVILKFEIIGIEGDSIWVLSNKFERGAERCSFESIKALIRASQCSEIHLMSLSSDGCRSPCRQVTELGIELAKKTPVQVCLSGGYYMDLAVFSKIAKQGISGIVMTTDIFEREGKGVLASQIEFDQRSCD